MRPKNLKSPLTFLLIILFSGFMLIGSFFAEEITELSKITPVTGEPKNATRIVITTSGPAKFTSYWLENPSRLVIEFQTKNIVSKIGNELIVNEGAIKKITSEYYGSGQNKPLKSLTFELLEKVPYKIWQEDNNIILDIQASLTVPTLFEEGKEVFTENETKDVIVKRLEAMDITLKQLPVAQVQTEPPKLIAKTTPPQGKTRGPLVFWFMALATGSQTIALWLIGLTSIFGTGLLFWLFWRRYKLILDKNVAAQEIEKLKSQVAEKNKLLEQEGIIRKTIEDTSVAREKEFEQLKLELQKEAKLLEEEEKARKAKEEELLKKEKESEQLKNSFESLKDVLVKKGVVKELTTPKEKGQLWILGKSPEARYFPRLDLSRDYNRTIILRIESQDKSKSIKSFANNISIGGLCFETRKDLEEKGVINLRLFFFGDKVPILKIKAEIIWKKTVLPVNYYGVSFVSIEEKDKAELRHYIESKITRG